MITTQEQLYIDKEKSERHRKSVYDFLRKNHIEDHEYKGFNKAFGIKIEGKEHYKQVMLRGGYIPFEEAMKIADENTPKRKDYIPSPNLVSFLKHLSMRARGKNGEIQLTGKEIETMQELGVNFDRTPKEERIM